MFRISRRSCGNIGSSESLLRGLPAAPERGDCWVADTGSDLVGYLLAAYIFSLEHGGLTAEIDELFVTAAGRSAGVGSQLLENAERVAGQTITRVAMNTKIFAGVMSFCLLSSSLLAADDPPASDPPSDPTLVGDQARAARDTLKQNAKAVADAAKQGVEQATNTAKDVAHEVAASTREGAQEVTNTAKNGSDKVKADALIAQARQRLANG